ncbi:MAG: NTP transferase domain-containing protein [Candidatus Heimdallarchaeota archaeon]|nr:NTP transferase domain-containing protein [Candidatus Heimdallarchaeota archaeon]
MIKMNAIIFAGHSDKDDLLCELENVPKKSFIKLGSKMFIERQVEEFLKCDFIEKIYLAGMTKDEWDTDHPVVYVEEGESIFDKAANVFRNHISKEEGHSEYVLLLSGDVPLIKSDMIQRFVEKCKEESGGEIDGIFYYPVVKKETM